MVCGHGLRLEIATERRMKH
jgi:hypothetical protein